MELGALVCTARHPRCGACPVDDRLRLAQLPAARRTTDRRARVQTYAGTDRQCRGRLLGVVRDAHEPVRTDRFDAAWADEAQRERCLASLVDDGLVAESPPASTRCPDRAIALDRVGEVPAPPCAARRRRLERQVEHSPMNVASMSWRQPLASAAVAPGRDQVLGQRPIHSALASARPRRTARVPSSPSADASTYSRQQGRDRR